jgi:hypothetical protein
MTSTVAGMGKRTVQIRVPPDLANDINIVAAALQKSVPEYAEEVLRAAVARDMAHAVKVAKDRADALRKARQRGEEERGDEE